MQEAPNPSTTIDLTQLDLSENTLVQIRERFGEIDLTSVDLTQVDLSGIDFSTADFSNIDLSLLDPNLVDLSVFDPASASTAAATFESFMQDPNLASIAAFAIVGGTLIGGLTLWLAGRKLVKPVFALLGAVAGGLIGAALLPATGIASALPASLSPVWVGLGLGSILGMGISIAAFRFALVAVSGVAGSALATLVAVVVLGVNSGQTAEAPPLENDELLLDGVRVAGEEAPAAEPSPDAPQGITADRARSFATELFDELRETYWEPVPVWKRSSVFGATFLGLLAGAAIGLLMPKRSTTLITSFAGAGLWLPSIASIASWAGAPSTWFDHPPIAWLIVWLVVSGLGVIIQVSGARKKKD